MIIFIPIKENSQRVPKKNFRDFNGIPLYKNTLLKFYKYRIFIDTDSEYLIKEIEKDPKLKHVYAYKRLPELIGDKISVNNLINYFVSNFCSEKEIIAQIHVTSPFLRPETIDKASEMMKDYDSVSGCNKIQSRLWKVKNNSFVPINHNPNVLLQTQDLDPIYEDNSAFYIFTKKSLLDNNNNRIGKNPYFYPISFPENIDIDTENEWNMAITLSKMEIK